MPDLVLVVEDEPANAVLVEAILTSLGGRYDRVYKGSAQPPDA